MIYACVVLYVWCIYHLYTQPDIMECPVCYCATVNCKLVCGHGLCTDCAKSWYKKSDEPNCPMCREPMYFRGMKKLKNDMEEERLEEHCADLFQEAVEDIFETWEMELLDLRKSDISPKMLKFFWGEIMADLKDAEKKIQVMYDQGWDIDEMRCVLEGWEFQYRQKLIWVDAPTKDQVPDIRYRVPQDILIYCKL